MKSEVVRIICHILRVWLVGLHYILTRRTKISVCFAVVTIGPISEPEARKEYLRKGNRCFLCLNQSHISRNCSETKTCYYCKGLHNSAICTKKKDSPEKFGLTMCLVNNLR